MNAYIYSDIFQLLISDFLEVLEDFRAWTAVNLYLYLKELIFSE